MLFTETLWFDITNGVGQRLEEKELQCWPVDGVMGWSNFFGQTTPAYPELMLGLRLIRVTSKMSCHQGIIASDQYLKSSFQKATKGNLNSNFIQKKHNKNIILEYV